MAHQLNEQVEKLGTAASVHVTEKFLVIGIGKTGQVRHQGSAGITNSQRLIAPVVTTRGPSYKSLGY